MNEEYKAKELTPDEVTEFLIEEDAKGYRQENPALNKEDFERKCRNRGIHKDNPVEKKLMDKMFKKYGFSDRTKKYF